MPEDEGVVIADVRPAEGSAGLGAEVRRGRLVLVHGTVERELHPLWLRDRASGPGDVDPTNGQRLVEPIEIPPELAVIGARLDGDRLIVTFSDGIDRSYSVTDVLVASELVPDAEAVPAPVAWAGGLGGVPAIDWSDVVARDVDALTSAVGELHRLGCLRIRNTPTEPGSLLQIAGHFGRISPTNFGALFDVETVPQPIDLAYSAVGLTAHTDQPYRRPTPGIQLLHSLVNDAVGGDSLIVDGLAAVEELRERSPDWFDLVATLPVEFRYDIGTDVVVGRAPIIDLDVAGRLRQLRFSTRLDAPPAVAPDVLDVYYAARRWLAEWFADPAHQERFRLDAGDVLLVDNHRVLHGRDPFDPTTGRRHLQGCYIDHDGPATLWRLLARTGQTIR